MIDIYGKLWLQKCDVVFIFGSLDVCWNEYTANKDPLKVKLYIINGKHATTFEILYPFL